MPTAVDFQRLTFEPTRRGAQHSGEAARHPVVVIGAGPVGLTLAIDLAQRGTPVVLLDNDNTLSTGSRAICFAKRTLEIFDRLGCGQRMADKGVSWSVGRVFFRDAEIYRFDLLPEPGHARPAFINLQQYYVEGYLAQRAAELASIDLRWCHRVVGIEQHIDHALLDIDTPDGAYRLRADQVVACDGSRSTLRSLVGETSEGRVFRDRFLIADVKMKIEQPAERWFWFDPAFHPGQSVLLHMQPDGVWRIDFQLGWEADPEVEKRPENIIPRVKALLANSAMRGMPFELEWASVYTFACTRMARFRVGRVLFAGDAAHGVSPFGARGANSGIQDADNLGWKLSAVVDGRAGDALLDSYASEREEAADENIRHSTRATDFITPKSAVSLLFRDAVLDLAREHAFARTLVNSGRLSTPTTFARSLLNTPTASPFAGLMAPGTAAVDAPVIRGDGGRGWLLRELGTDFTALIGDGADSDAIADRWQQAAEGLARLHAICIAPTAAVRDAQIAATADTGRAGKSICHLVDHAGLVAARYDLTPGSVYLLRPDQHVCARWREGSALAVSAMRDSLKRALAIA